MSGAFWIALRDVTVRWRRVALAALVVATLAGASVAMELLSRSREQAVATEIDAMGAPLTVVPSGVTASALARRELGSRMLPPDAPARVAAALGSALRAVEARLVASHSVAGSRVPLVGLPASALPQGMPAHGAVALGSELARRLGSPAHLALGGRSFPVVATLPSTGSADDLGVFLALADAQQVTGSAGVNEARVYLRAGVSPRDAEARLLRSFPGAGVVRSDRGEVAERDTQASLARHRDLAYGVMAVVAALCLLVAAHLDASERRVELATLVALGASRRTVLLALVARSALVSATGALAGVAMGAGLALVQDGSVAGALAGAAPVAATLVAGALALGIAAAAPNAIAAALRDPVRDLQEG
jgi:putative ABC transport system permease protein